MSQVIKIKRKFSTGAPTTSNLAEGEIAINTFDKKLYIRDNANAIIEIGGGGASSGATTEVTQSSHGLAVKECIRHNGSSWIKAQADSGDTLALGVVTVVTDSNTFTVAQSGRFELTSHGLTVGQWYYLSASSAGALTATEPTISQPLVYVESANVIFVFPYRPTNLLVSGSSSIIPGDDTVATAKIQDDAVTYAKIQNVSATDRILGRDTAGAGVVEEITPANLRTMINVADGANAYVHPNHSGEVTSTADGATVIASDIVDEDNLKISNAGSNGQYLQKTSNTGGLTWADVAAGLTLVAVQTSSFTAAAGNQYLCNTTGGAFNMTLPAGTAGDTIGIIDYLGTFDTNNLTLVQSGSEKIFRVDANGTIDSKNWSTSIKYMDATVGWLPAGD